MKLFSNHSFQSANGRFRKGTHWRDKKPFWDKEWLEAEYTVKQRSAADIAKQFGLRETALHYWLNKHGIKVRSIKEARAVKYWGPKGEANPMFGKTGKKNPNWKGGVTAERQAFYSTQAWRKARSFVLKRDKATCQHCGAVKVKCNPKRFDIHHIISFAVKKKRADVTNLVLLCRTCHRWVHSKKNVHRLFLGGKSK